MPLSTHLWDPGWTVSWLWTWRQSAFSESGSEFQTQTSEPRFFPRVPPSASEGMQVEGGHPGFAVSWSPGDGESQSGAVVPAGKIGPLHSLQASGGVV